MPRRRRGAARHARTSSSIYRFGNFIDRRRADFHGINLFPKCLWMSRVYSYPARTSCLGRILGSKLALRSAIARFLDLLIVPRFRGYPLCASLPAATFSARPNRISPVNSMVFLCVPPSDAVRYIIPAIRFHSRFIPIVAGFALRTQARPKKEVQLSGPTHWWN